MVWSEHAALQKSLISKIKGKDGADFVFWQRKCNSLRICTWRSNCKCCILRSVLDCLCKHIVCVRPEMRRDRKFLLLHDNAHLHSAAIIQLFLAKRGVAQLSHPPCLPDLSPHPDYFVFPKLQLELKSDHYASIEDIVKLKAFSISDFMRTMKRLEDRTDKCIRVSRDYFE